MTVEEHQRHWTDLSWDSWLIKAVAGLDRIPPHVLKLKTLEALLVIFSYELRSRLVEITFARPILWSLSFTTLLIIIVTCMHSLAFGDRKMEVPVLIYGVLSFAVLSSVIRKTAPAGK